MLYFIPAWYQQNQWCENEQYWYSKRTRTEFDDTVKHIQLFHRSKVHPFQILLLSFAPNFRHFLHRQGVFHAPYWSCFDAIQEVRRKKVKMFSFHNLNWPEHIEFIYTSFALIARLHGEKYAQVEFGEDGNTIQVDMYQNNQIQRRNIYDDRGFVSATIRYEQGQPQYQDYLNDSGVWKIRHFFEDGHVEVNPKANQFLLQCDKSEVSKTFSKNYYENMQEIISEVLQAYVALLEDDAQFCVAVHELHIKTVQSAIPSKKMILSFFENRYPIEEHQESMEWIKNAGYILMDSKEHLIKLQENVGGTIKNCMDITPFDSRVDFGISQQLNVQKILVPIDDMDETRYMQLIACLGQYLQQNENAQVHLFTRMAKDYKKSGFLEQARKVLQTMGLPREWANEPFHVMSENRLDKIRGNRSRFFVENCVSELEVSKCMREQRILLDMRDTSELYLQITAISMGIPQIVNRKTPFVEHGKNGMIIQDVQEVLEALRFYLENLSNWNEAVVSSYELGKHYTTQVLIDKWKEVIEFVGKN